MIQFPRPVGGPGVLERRFIVVANVAVLHSVNLVQLLHHWRYQPPLPRYASKLGKFHFSAHVSATDDSSATGWSSSLAGASGMSPARWQTARLPGTYLRGLGLVSTPSPPHLSPPSWPAPTVGP